jgi:carbon storage regulator CsrA
MLVLSRGRRQSVVIGDEITLTVEDVCDGNDGRHIVGGTVRLGFQTPRYVSIYRSELRAKPSSAAHQGGVAPRPQRPAGRLVEVPNAQARLRIVVPRKVPVCHNGTPVVGRDFEEGCGADAGSPRTVYRVTCGKEDRITICHNIIIAALDLHRFVFSEQPACLVGQ